MLTNSVAATTVRLDSNDDSIIGSTGGKPASRSAGLAPNATLYRNLPFDTLRDIAPVAHFGATPNLLVVTNSLPVTSVQEFSPKRGRTRAPSTAARAGSEAPGTWLSSYCSR